VREEPPALSLVNEPLAHGVAGQTPNWGMRIRWPLPSSEQTVRALWTFPSAEYRSMSEVLPSVLAPL
jgi:hypothetical protein